MAGHYRASQSIRGEGCRFRRCAATSGRPKSRRIQEWRRRGGQRVARAPCSPIAVTAGRCPWRCARSGPVIAQWKASIHKEGCGPRRFFTLINWRRILGTFIRVVVRCLVVYTRVKSLPFNGAVQTPSKYFYIINALRAVFRKRLGCVARCVGITY